MIPEALTLAGAVVVLVAFLVWRQRQTPRYLITLQKVTNVNQMAETLTVQANLPARASSTDIWEEIELKLALPAQARAISINEEILANVAETAEQIKARQGRVLSAKERFHFDKKRSRLAKRLGKPVTEVTDDEVREAIARARVMAPAPEAPG